MRKLASPWRIVLCLAIGLGGSYVSGWVGAVRAQRIQARPPPPPTRFIWGTGMMMVFPASPEVVAEAPEQWRHERWHSTGNLSLGLPFGTNPAFDAAYLDTRTGDGDRRTLRIRRAAHGWPWVGVKSVRQFDSALGGFGAAHGVDRNHGTFEHADHEVRTNVIRRGLRVPNPLAPPEEHLLPLDPVWPGLASNTLAYGGAAWALLASPTIVSLVFGRARRRERLGLCVACGYDRRGLDRCPECGAGL